MGRLWSPRHPSDDALPPFSCALGRQMKAASAIADPDSELSLSMTLRPHSQTPPCSWTACQAVELGQASIVPSSTDRLAAGYQPPTHNRLRMNMKPLRIAGFLSLTLMLTASTLAEPPAVDMPAAAAPVQVASAQQWSSELWA